MSISVICPFRNELFFAPAWLANVQRFADEIVLYDTGSSDGTRQYFEEQRDKVKIRMCIKDFPIQEGRWNHDGNEHLCRNAMIRDCNYSWILALDIDELIDSEVIQVLRSLHYIQESALHGSYIIKFVNYEFWGSLDRLRGRSWWPPASIYKKDDGWHFKLLRNWRGMFPTRKPRLFRNHPDIRYREMYEHCFPQYKNWGRWTYRSRSLVCNSDFPLYHFHYAFGAHRSGSRNRDEEIGKQVNLIKFHGVLPEEYKLFGTVT